MKKGNTPCGAADTLKSAGISRTPHRLAVLSILQRATRPLSVGDIRKALEPDIRINKVTVYRIIAVLKKIGVIRDVSSSGGGIYFEMSTSDHPVHPHFSCTSCGTINCLTPLTFSQTRQLLNSPDHARVDHIEINISGLCTGCLHAMKLQSKPFLKGQK